jgi:hypothetical protein
LRNKLSVVIVVAVALFLLAWVGVSLYVLGRGLWNLAEQARSRASRPELETAPRERGSLLAARAGHKTAIPRPRRGTGGAPAVPPQGDPGAIAPYQSAGGPLVAYHLRPIPPPPPGTRSPVVVWASRQPAGLGREVVADVAPFRKAGFVVYCPSYRGQHSNWGRVEHFFGEVDDLRAAITHAASLDGVDSDRVYVVGAGANAGGTLTLLTAVSGAIPRVTPRAFVAIDPYPDLTSDLNAPGYPIQGTLLLQGRELELRSATPFVGAIRVPTLAVETTGLETRRTQHAELAARASRANVPFRSLVESNPDAGDLTPQLVPILADCLRKDVDGSRPLPLTLFDPLTAADQR